ncbi:MAG: sulfotransferase [Methylovulum sp.]|nr:sulfotransferase [Methylovulum sp.]
MKETKRQPNLNFLGIGAQKAATSWLHSQLSQHPDIFLPHRKELHFFDSLERQDFEHNKLAYMRSLGREINKQISNEKPDLKRIEWYFRLANMSNTISGYDSLFSAERISGEITPAYAALKSETVALIKNNYPNLKIIFIMRDPVDRAISGAFQGFRTINPDDITKDMILSEINSNHQRKRNNYRKTIKTWESHFTGTQFCYLFYDDIKRDSLAVLKQICHFLEISYKEEYFVSTDEVVYKTPKKNIDESIVLDLATQYQELYEWLEKRFPNETTIAWRLNNEKIIQGSAGRPS